MSFKDQIKAELYHRLDETDFTAEFINEITTCCQYTNRFPSDDESIKILGDIIFSSFQMSNTSNSILATNTYLFEDFCVWNTWLKEHFPNDSRAIVFSQFMDEINDLSIFMTTEALQEDIYLRKLKLKNNDVNKSLEKKVILDVELQCQNLLLCDSENFLSLSNIEFYSNSLNNFNRISLLTYELLDKNLDKSLMISHVDEIGCKEIFYNLKKISFATVFGLWIIQKNNKELANEKC